VVAVSASQGHMISKVNREAIRLIAGVGVEGDAHAGATVKHRSRVAKDATRPNLRQVHLIHAELHDELRAAGYEIVPGQMGENITTRGIDLLRLSTGCRLHLGDSAVVEVTGLRNPCYQLDGIQPGLMKAVLAHDARGRLIRKAGIMAIVLVGGVIRADDAITVELPAEKPRRLKVV
jgi:MOSC domain-containing protein YiiM